MKNLPNAALTGEPRLWTRDFTLLSGAQLLMAVAFYASMPVFALFMENELRITGALLGLAVSSSTVSALLMRPLAGYWLDVLGRKAVYLPSFAAFSVLFFLYPLAGTLLFAAAARFVHGLSWGAVISASNTVAVDLIPPSRRGEGIGFFGLCMVLAMAVGPLMGMTLVRAHGFNALFFTAAGLSLAGLAVALPVRIPSVRRPPREGRRITPASLFEKSSLPLAVCAFFVTVPYGCVMNFIALFAQNEIHATGGLFFACFAVGTGLSRVGAGKLYDRLGPKRILAASFLLLGGGLLLLAFFRHPALFGFAALVQGFGDGMCIPIFMAMISDMAPPDRRGAAIGTLMTFFELGICAGVLLTGALYGPAGWTAVFLIHVLSVLVAALICRLWALPLYFARVRTGK